MFFDKVLILVVMMPFPCSRKSQNKENLKYLQIMCSHIISVFWKVPVSFCIFYYPVALSMTKLKIKSFQIHVSACLALYALGFYSAWTCCGGSGIFRPAVVYNYQKQGK